MVSQGGRPAREMPGLNGGLTCRQLKVIQALRSAEIR